MEILAVNFLSLYGPQRIKYKRFSDNRGYFSEHYREAQLREVIPDFAVVQANESFSKQNTFRGLHAQWQPQMGKLVRTIQGHMWDIILDIRCDSPTFGKVAVIDMPANCGDETNMWLWVPPGFAHGNFFIEDTTIEYLCTAEYAGDTNEISISPFASDLDWALCRKEKEQIKRMLTKIIQSPKDQQGVTLSQWKVHRGFSEFKGLI